MLNWNELMTAAEEDSWIYRVDPRMKVIALILAGVLIIVLDRLTAFGGIFFLAVLCAASARLPRMKVKVMAAVVLIGLWGAVFSQALFYQETPRTVWMTLLNKDMPVLGPWTQGIYIYKEGAVHGLVQGLRMADMTVLGLLVCWTTESRALLLGLVRLGFPYGLSFMAVTAVRFIPVVMEEMGQVIAARRLRGGKRWVYQPGAILIPVLAACLRRAGTLAVAVESRAFRADGPRTNLTELSYSLGERICLAFLIGGTVAVVGVKILYWMAEYGWWYHGKLRLMYEIAQRWL